MNYRQVRNGHTGFIFIPIIIAIAIVAALGVGGTVVYRIQKQDKAEKERLRSEITELKKETPVPSLEPTTTPSATPVLSKKILKVTQKRVITSVESKEEKPTPVPVKPTPTPVKVTLAPTATPVSPVFQPQPTTNVFELQQKAEQERITRVRQQLQSAIADIDSQIAVLNQQIQEKQNKIDYYNDIPASMTEINRATAPLITEKNALIYQYNSLIDQRAPLVRELLSL